MGYWKRKRQHQRERRTLGALDKTASVSGLERAQAAYLMHYGSAWVRHWWRDHPGAYEEKPDEA